MKKNAEAYVAQLKELDQEFQDVVDHSKRKLMIFGDRFPFRYFAEAYGRIIMQHFQDVLRTQSQAQLQWRF